MLNFDFVIAGKNCEKDLQDLLVYLKINYWKKISRYVFGKNEGQISVTCSKIVNAVGILDIKSASIKDASNKINFDIHHINREIKSNFNLNFSDLKKLFININNKIF